MDFPLIKLVKLFYGRVFLLYVSSKCPVVILLYWNEEPIRIETY